MHKPERTISEVFADEYQQGYDDGDQGTYRSATILEDMALIKLYIAHATPAELRTLRAIINGKLSKRTISPEQQQKMQDARKR